MLAGLKGSRSLIGNNSMATFRRLMDSPISSPSLFRPSFHSGLTFLHFRNRPIRYCSSSCPPSSFPMKDQESALPKASSEEWFRTDAEDAEWYKVQAEDEEWFRREEEFYEARVSEIAEGGKQPLEVQPDYLALSESALFAQCRMDTFRASGPGGQHRNKTDSGVRLTHLPTGIVAQAVEDRSQHKNRAIAMTRLRFLIACKVRRHLKLNGYKPPPELLRLLPSERGRKPGDKIGVNHPDYPKGVQALLDLLAASQGYVLYAATLLRVSPAAFSKVLTSDKTLLQATNELLVSKGQKPFK